MKRFYTAATFEERAGDWSILLDGRPLRTPAKHALAVPNMALACAIADEWNAQGDKIDPRSMPMTGLTNAAIDHVGGGRAAFIGSLAIFAETDLVCYRADAPCDLAGRQSAAWDPLVDWAARRYDCRLRVTTGIAHVAQDAAVLARFRAALDAMNDFEIAAMQPIVTIAGSLVIALALAESAITADAAFDAGHADELYQTEKWGDDAEALAVREARKNAFTAAARFLMLLRPSPEQAQTSE